MPLWANYSSTPNNEISLLGDWEEKMPAIIDETIHQNVTSLAGVPSWMLVLLNAILEKTHAKNIKDIWPDLEVYFHGGVSFDPYLNQYQKLIPDNNFKYYEIYNASEGFFAIQDQNDSKDLLLMLNYGIYYEFIPMDIYGREEEHAITLDEVKIGVNYAMIITTNAGLWRYKIGDTIRFTSTNPYRIKSYRTHQTPHQCFWRRIDYRKRRRSPQKVAQEFDVEIVDYSVGPFLWKVKTKVHMNGLSNLKPPQNIQAFRQSLDQNLRDVNSDYDAKRHNDITLNLLKLHVAKKNLFYTWLKSNEKLGGST